MNMKIKNWRIKSEYLGKVDDLFFQALGKNLSKYAEINQSIGLIVAEVGEKHLNALSNAYLSTGIWLTKNNKLDINFKQEKGEVLPPAFIG